MCVVNALVGFVLGQKNYSTFPKALPSLTTLRLGDNRLRNLTVPDALPGLNALDLRGNQLTNLTFAASITNLTELNLQGNPLNAFVLSELLSRISLVDEQDALQKQAVPIFAYPLTLSLRAGRQTVANTFALTLHGPPGTYRLEVTDDFETWTALDPVSIATGTTLCIDGSTSRRPQGSYRAIRVE